MKPRPPTKADKRHLEELIELINDAYVDGKPMARVLEAIRNQRWAIIGSCEDKIIALKRRVKALEDELNQPRLS